MTVSLPPSPWVARFAGFVRSGGAVLDVACGSGRHLRLFAQRGHPVVGIDRDLSGVADLQDHSGVELFAADLEDGSPWPVPAARRFAGIVVTNYLHRPLFPMLLDALEPGGTLIYETFAKGNERFGRPSSPAFLLNPGELLEIVGQRLQVVAFEQCKIAEPRPAVIQRLCAVADHEPRSLFDGDGIKR